MAKHLLIITVAVLILSPVALKGDEDVIWSNGKAGHVATDDMKRYRVSITPPEYPLEARRQRITGNGVFELRLDKAGKVKSIVIAKSTGSQMLDQAAMRGLIGFRYKPGAFLKVFEPVAFTMGRPVF